MYTVVLWTGQVRTKVLHAMITMTNDSGSRRNFPFMVLEIPPSLSIAMGHFLLLLMHRGMQNVLFLRKHLMNVLHPIPE